MDVLEDGMAPCGACGAPPHAAGACGSCVGGDKSGAGRWSEHAVASLVAAAAALGCSEADVRRYAGVG